MPASPLHLKLRQLLGQEFLYLSERWVLIDLLSDRDCVVLQRVNKDNQDLGHNMQTDQFGQAQRRSSETLCLPISVGDGYSDELLMLLEGKTQRHSSSD